jgi:hypothetical protein
MYKEVTKFIYKDVKIATTSGKLVEGYFGGYVDDEDVDTIVIDPDRNNDFGELIDIPVPKIDSIEVVE